MSRPKTLADQINRKVMEVLQNQPYSERKVWNLYRMCYLQGLVDGMDRGGLFDDLFRQQRKEE